MTYQLRERRDLNLKYAMVGDRGDVTVASDSIGVKYDRKEPDGRVRVDNLHVVCTVYWRLVH